MITLDLNEIWSNKYLSILGSIIGKYELIELVSFSKERYSHDEIKYKVRCTKCGWTGITSYRSILKSKNKEPKKCSHIGGSNIHPGDKFGKYEVIKRLPSKLCNNGLLIPYYKVKCTRCGKITTVSVSTLYATKNRKINDVCKHKGV